MSNAATVTDPLGEEQPSLFQGGPLDQNTPKDEAGRLDLGSLDSASAGSGVKPGDADPASAPPTETAAPEPAPDARVAALEASLDQANQTIQQLLAGQQTPKITPPAEPEPNFDLGAPPDAVTQPAEFQKWVERIPQVAQAQIRHEVEKGRQEVTEGQYRERLWNDFQSTHADVAGDEALVSAAFASEVEKRGGDVPRDPTLAKELLQAVADRLRGVAGKPAAAGGTPPKAEPTRTAGVSGGTTEAPARGATSEASGEDEKVVPFSEQMLNHQPSEFF